MSLKHDISLHLKRNEIKRHLANKKLITFWLVRCV